MLRSANLGYSMALAEYDPEDYDAETPALLLAFWEKAAALGDPSACVKLGDMLSSVPDDAGMERARGLWREAAELGEHEGQI